MSILFIIAISFVLIDVSISSLVDIYFDFTTSISGVSLFIAISGVLFGATYAILRITESKIGVKKLKGTYEKSVRKSVWVVYYLMMGMNAGLILQLILFSEYYTPLLSIASSVSYGLAAFVTGSLAYRFFSWFARNKALVVLLYGVASVSASLFVSLLGVIFYIEIFIHQPVLITLESAANYPEPEPGFEEILIVNLPIILSAITFLSFWGGTIVILHANIRRIGNARFWILVTAPIIFFLGTLISLYPEIQGPMPENDPNSIIIPVYTTNFSQIIAIALFATAFVSMAKGIREHLVSTFMYVTCYGLSLFSIGMIASISGAGYPPFGLPTISLVGCFSFLLYMGLYRTAISTAEDSSLRQSIRTSTRQQLKLLKSMGTSEMELKIEKKVLDILRSDTANLVQQSGIEPTLSIDETRKYVSEALEEARKIKHDEI
jgi:hypothetical protein